MSTLQRSVLIVALGFALLLLRSVVWRAVALGPFTPQLVLPMAIFLGVSPDVRLVRGAVIAFLLGYLSDGFCGLLLSQRREVGEFRKRYKWMALAVVVGRLRRDRRSA
jgi:hypothetical protein